MSRKGFTLVELLAVIVILAIVIGIGGTSVVAIRNNSLNRMLESKKNDIVNSAILYGQDNLDELTMDDCEVDGNTYHYCKDITVYELLNANYYSSNYTNSSSSIDVLNDVTQYSMLCDVVRIYRKNNNTYATLINVYSDSSNCCSNGSGC